MMSNINTKDWNAFENRQPGPSTGNAFYVIGEVETNNGRIQPVLTKANPQGVNEKILILDLALEDQGGFGTADIAYRPVRYDEQISEGQYTQVQIMYQGEEVVCIKVSIVS